MTVWLFSSKNFENLKVAQEHLMWAFWDREIGEKQQRNWRTFIRMFNRIKPFDIVLFQIARTGEIYGLGIVKRTYYDDQTPVWPEEIKNKKVLFPWRVELAMFLLSKVPLTTKFISIENYLDGYGIAGVPEHLFRNILSKVLQRLQEQDMLFNILQQ